MSLVIALLAASAVFLMLMPDQRTVAPASPWSALPDAPRRFGWLTVRLADLLSSSRVERDLAVSGLNISLEELAFRKLRLTGLAVAATAVLFLLGRTSLAAASLLAVAWAFQGPDLDVARLAARRRTAIQRDLPFFLFTLAVLAESGLQLLPALEQYARHSQTALAAEVRVTLAEIQLGQTPVLAFLEMAQRLDVRDFSLFVGALVQTMEKGTDGLAATLRMQAEAAWDKRRRLAQELGAKASVKLLIPLILFVLPAVLAMAAGPAIYAFLTQLGS